MWRLFVVDGGDRGTTADVDDTPALVGAAPASTLVLTDDTVSRYHAEIDVFAEGLRIRDLDSTNGTFLEGDDRIRDAFVENGGTFRVGRTTVRLIAIDEPAASEIETDPRGVPPGAIEHFGQLVGVTPAGRELFRIVRKVAPSSSAVLLEGEDATGRGMLAEQLHALSPRQEHPLVRVDLETVPAEEVSRALFGEAGEPPTLGLIERANHGTLFVENVERLPTELQPRLRQVIERGELTRNGADRSRRVDVRVLSSCRRNLADAPGFDATLRRRISVVRLEVPPLRERPEDAAAIVEHVVRKAGRADSTLGSRVRDLLKTQRYDSNADDAKRFAEVLLQPGGSRREGFDGVLVEAYLTDAMETHRGDVAAAARTIGLEKAALFRLLATYDVDLDAF